jgi:hypothetical protein
MRPPFLKSPAKSAVNRETLFGQSVIGHVPTLQLLKPQLSPSKLSRIRPGSPLPGFFYAAQVRRPNKAPQISAAIATGAASASMHDSTSVSKATTTKSSMAGGSFDAGLSAGVKTTIRSEFRFIVFLRYWWQVN